jgi:hypothetical protein
MTILGLYRWLSDSLNSISQERNPRDHQNFPIFGGTFYKILNQSNLPIRKMRKREVGLTPGGNPIKEIYSLQEPILICLTFQESILRQYRKNSTIILL